MKKKLILGIMILLLAGVLCMQSSFATSLVIPSTGSSDNNTTDNTTTTPTPKSTTSTDTESTSTTSTGTSGTTTTPDTGLTQGSFNNGNVATNNNNNSSSRLNNSLSGTNSFVYNNNNNNTSLPKTGLDNSLIFILTAAALISVVIAFKKISDYGNI